MCCEITFFPRTMNRKKDNRENLAKKVPPRRHWLSLCMFCSMLDVESTSHAEGGSTKNLNFRRFNAKFSRLRNNF